MKAASPQRAHTARFRWHEISGLVKSVEIVGAGAGAGHGSGEGVTADGPRGFPLGTKDALKLDCTGEHTKTHAL